MMRHLEDSLKSDSIIEWSSYCQQLYLVYQKDIKSFINIFLVLSTNGVISLNIENSSSLCCYIQLFSKCLKSERSSSHPERFLDNHDVGHLNNPISSNGAGIIESQIITGVPQIDSLAIFLWEILPVLKNKLFEFNHGYIHFYFLCLLLDLLKFEKSKDLEIYNSMVSQQFNHVELSLSIMKEIFTTFAPLLSYLKALDIVSCICSIVTTTISAIRRERGDNSCISLNDSIQKIFDSFNSLSDFMLSLFPSISLAFSKIEISSPSSSSPFSCGFIEDSSPQVFAACGVTVWTTLINTMLTYVLTIVPPNTNNIYFCLSYPNSNPNDIDKNSRCQTTTTTILSAMKITSLIELLVNLFISYNAVNVLRVLGENDKDLISSLLQLEEVHIRLKSLLNHQDSSGSSNSDNNNLNHRFHSITTTKSLQLTDNKGNEEVSEIQFWVYFLAISQTLTDELDTIYLFVILLVDILCLDCTVLIDLLSSPETPMLEYLLRITKILLVKEGCKETDRLIKACCRYESEKKKLRALVPNTNRNDSKISSKSNCNSNASYDSKVLVDSALNCSASGSNGIATAATAIRNISHINESTLTTSLYSDIDGDDSDCAVPFSVSSVLGKRHRPLHHGDPSPSPSTSSASKQQPLPNASVKSTPYSNLTATTAIIWTANEMEVSEECLANIRCVDDILSLLHNNKNHSHQAVSVGDDDDLCENSSSIVGDDDDDDDDSQAGMSIDGEAETEGCNEDHSSNCSIDSSNNSDDWDSLDNGSVMAATATDDCRRLQEGSGLEFRDDDRDVNIESTREEASVDLLSDASDNKSNNSNSSRVFAGFPQDLQGSEVTTVDPTFGNSQSTCPSPPSVLCKQVLEMLSESSERISSLSKRNIFPFNAELLCDRLDRIVIQH